MKLRVNVDKLEDERERVDHRVGVRFGFLVREGRRLNSQQINEELRKIAFSSDIGSSLSDIIRHMVSSFAYREARLGLPEFIHRFRENKLGEVIADSFVGNLITIDQDEYLRETHSNGFLTVSPADDLKSKKKLEAAYMDVLLSTLEYLKEVKLNSAATIYKFLSQKKVERPMVQIQDLFTMQYEEFSSEKGSKMTSLRDKIVEKIYEDLEKVAATAYEEMFEEDRRGFVMGYLMGRVFKYDADKKKMIFDVFELRALMDYLSDIGADINDINGRTLYDLLYEENQFMAKYVLEQRIGALRFGVREDIADTGVLDEFAAPEYEEPVIFEEGFNVKAFYDKYLKPELFKFYSKKQKQVTKIREVDLLVGIHDTNSMGRNKNTVYLFRYAKTLVETHRRDPALFMAKIRELFGLVKAPYINELTDEQVNQHFEYYFRAAEEKFNLTIKEALYYRGDDAVFAACQYPQEILKCRSLPKLLEWFVSPHVFKEDCPGYDNLPNDQIAYACAAFLRDFLRLTDQMSKKSFIEVEKKRDLVQNKIIETLDIQFIDDVDVKFRDLRAIDVEGHPIDSEDYDAVIDPTSIEEFLSGQDHLFARHLLMSPNLVAVNKEGKHYRIYAQESKKFKLAEMTIPIMPLDAKKRTFSPREHIKVRVLIYSGDDHYIHVKEALTRILTMDRGKKGTDDLRWLLCFPDEYSLRVFKEYMYSHSPTTTIKVEDLEENRKFSKKAKTRNNAASTESFKKFQDFKIVREINVAEPSENGTLQRTGVVLETQAYMVLKNLLTGSLSEYTEQSHDRYRAQRAWPLLFSRYFPPYIFGDRYKAFDKQGYDYPS